MHHNNFHIPSQTPDWLVNHVETGQITLNSLLTYPSASTRPADITLRYDGTNAETIEGEISGNLRTWVWAPATSSHITLRGVLQPGIYNSSVWDAGGNIRLQVRYSVEPLNEYIHN
jgi:hypothetical protein